MIVAEGRQMPRLIETLKCHLKAQGLRQHDIANHLGVGLATVKRWLNGEGLTTKRLEDLCDLAKIEFYELVISTGNEQETKLKKFSPSQERVLGENPMLFFLFFSLLNGWPTDDYKQELNISDDIMQQQLQHLERIGLIDILAKGRIRVLTARNVSWDEDGPVAKYFQARQSFIDTGNAPREAMYMSDFVRLSDTGEAHIRQMMEDLRREIHRIAQIDRHDKKQSRVWHGILFFARPLNMDRLRTSMSGQAE